MSFTEMSLPVNVPWKRMGVSKNMIDAQSKLNAGAAFPAMWKSSIAVFYHEPAELPPEYCQRKVTYLKVVCTISSFLAKDDEIGGKIAEYAHYIDELNMPYESGAALVDIPGMDQCLPCFGALLQVSILPKAEGPVPLEDYPYVSAFEPTKREMYEAVTESGEILSQSANNVNVGKQMTDTVSSENYDLDTGSASSWGSSRGSGGSQTEGGSAAFGVAQWSNEDSYQSSESSEGSVSNTGQWGTTSRNNQQSQQVTNIDLSREKRESLSHSTSLNHIYSLLQGYHLGTNRVVFHVQPRPHIQQSKFSFAQGMRQLEGIQEFFLVVNRPASIPGFCVEATLETTHVTTFKTYRPRFIPLNDLYMPENLAKTAEALRLDVGQIPDYAEYARLMNTWNYVSADYRMLAHEQIKNFTLTGWPGSPAIKYDLLKVIAKTPNVGIEEVALVFEEYEGYGDQMVVLGRFLRACTTPTAGDGSGVDQEQSGSGNVSDVENEESVVFTQSLPETGALYGRRADVFFRAVNEKAVASLGSPRRHAYGQVSFFDSPLVADRLAQLLGQLAAAGIQDQSLAGFERFRPYMEKGLGKKRALLRVTDLARLTCEDIREELGVSRTEATKIRGQLLRAAVTALNPRTLKTPLTRNAVQDRFNRRYPPEKMRKLIASAYRKEKIQSSAEAKGAKTARKRR
ncbi:MAG: hypothetical protein AB1439_07375 [candidate division FCPU426 bacterium]